MPTRTCVGCRRSLEVDVLVRYRLDNGVLSGEASLGGRGVWMCAGPAAACWSERGLAQRMARTLRVPVNVVEPALQTLMTAASGDSAGGQPRSVQG